VGKKKRKRDQPGKQQARDKAAQRAIARAEGRLAKSLQRLDEARADMSKRETQLADTLRKHGRLPDVADAGATESSASANGAANETALSASSAAAIFVEVLDYESTTAAARQGDAQFPASDPSGDEHS
jgi:hypothetical protein